MPKYYMVSLYKLNAVNYLIEANDKVDAIEKILAGNPAVVETDIPLGIAELYGETVRNLIEDEKHLDLFCEARDIGLDDHIWGVRAVREA